MVILTKEIRIYAMYERKKAVVVFVAVIFCVELGVNAWLLTHGVGTCIYSMVS